MPPITCLIAFTGINPTGFFIFMIAILFSFEQGGFHIETMTEYIQSNWMVTKLKKDHQWRLVAIAESEFEADAICDKLSKREPFKSNIPC
jgi:hypothetical protein